MKTTVLTILVMVGTLTAQGQQAPDGGDDLTNQPRCLTVAMQSQSTSLPASFMAPYLQNRADFRRANLVLNTESDTADVVVRLSDGELGSTRIVVTNSKTHESIATASSWTLYPGMVASDVMTQVKAVCAQPIALVVRTAYPRADASNARLRGFGVCSRTIWMKQEDLDEAFRSRKEFPQHLMYVVAGCDLKGTALEVTHDAGDPVEWQWKLKTEEGNVLAAGRVIGASSRDAAGKIAEEVTGDVVLRSDAKLRSAIDDGVENPWAAEVSGSAQQGQVRSAAQAARSHGFKHVMGQVGWWTGQVLVDAAYVAGYAAYGIAVSAASAQ